MRPAPDLRCHLEHLAAAARDALSRHRAQLGLYLSDFPRGACGPVSEVLGRVIYEELGTLPMYVNGMRHPRLRPDQSHAWLMIDGLIIDITHDQFEDTGLFGWVFRESAWHAMFEEVAKPRPPILSADQWPAYPAACYGLVSNAVRMARQ